MAPPRGSFGVVREGVVSGSWSDWRIAVCSSELIDKRLVFGLFNNAVVGLLVLFR